jgi:PTH2 family peptidyl-tRNA hydrolase
MSKDPKMVIVVRTDLGLRRGKESAQAGHAAMAWAKHHTLSELKDWEPLKLWALGLEKKIVVGVGSLGELEALVQEAADRKIDCYVIRDAGLTEIPPGTVTCCSFGPDLPERLDPFLGHLKLR